MRCLLVLLSLAASQARWLDFDELGGVAEDSSATAEWHNGGLLNATLANLTPGDVIYFPNKTYHLMGGIRGFNLQNLTIQIDGTLQFSKRIDHWPCASAKSKAGFGPFLICAEPLEVMELWGQDVRITSLGRGVIDGNGPTWWGIPGIGYLYRGESRPRLMHIHGERYLIENILFKNSPYWTFLADGVWDVEIRWSEIDNARISHTHHTAVDLSAANTDGFDFTACNNVWVHDCTVWNQDDCFDVKDGSENLVFERINASGLGLTIGSIGGSTVRNITFRDAYMKNTKKAFYLKFRSAGTVADVLYENIVVDSPEDYAIWIGPAQQSDDEHDPLCHPNPCSICWPSWKVAMPGPMCLSCHEPQCSAVPNGIFNNITFKNIVINNPKLSPGVLMAASETPMHNIIFDNVRVNNPGMAPWGKDYYYCQNVMGRATGGTWPVPPCFQEDTVLV